MEKETMRQVLTRAKGSRSFTQYAKDCGISRATMYKIARGDIKRQISKETVDALVKNAHNDVTKEDILDAGLYALETNYLFSVRSEKEIEKMVQKMSTAIEAMRLMNDSFAKAISEYEEKLESLKTTLKELEEFEGYEE